MSNADAGGNRDLKWRFGFPRANRKIAFVEALTILLTSNGKSLGQLAGPVGETGCRSMPMPALIHKIETGKRFERANKNAPRLIFAVGNDVEALVHTVDEVDVSASRRAKQNPSALRFSARGMSSQVVEAEIGFGLDDHSGRFAVDDHAAQERGREFGGRTREEIERQRLGCTHQPA